MSTCRGAKAPHENCIHGDYCDWQDPAQADVTEKLRVLLYGHPVAVPEPETEKP